MTRNTTDLSSDFDGELVRQADRRMQDDLEAVRNSAAQLLGSMHRPPTMLRIRAGDIVLELEWPGPAASAAALPPMASPEPSGGPQEPGRRHICAPTVGVFYRSPEPGAPPFVREGDTVTPGQQVGIIEAMKLLIPIEADAAGRVAEVLKSDAEPVEYGEPLFALVADDLAQG